jgi:hypothetical protein
VAEGEKIYESTKNGWTAPWTAIFANAKMNEVSSTCFCVGALMLLFLLLYSVVEGVFHVTFLSSVELHFTFVVAILILIYAAVWTSIKALAIGKSTEVQ